MHVDRLAGGEKGDAALVVAAQGGDKEAFATLLDRHHALLLALCRRALGDPAMAEDAVQEAVLQALLSLERLRRPERFGPWLGGIGLNICRRLLRERSRGGWSWDALYGGRRVASGQDDDAATGLRVPLDDRPGPAELAEEADLRRRVRQAVAALPRGQRAAVLLFYLSGLTQAETAAHLGIPVSAVKTRLHKARGTLRQRLWAIWKEEDMAATTDTPLVEVRVADVRRGQMDDGQSRHVIVLEEMGGTRQLYIYIGRFEGEAMALSLEKVEVPRPLTYTFMAHLLMAGGGRVREARITRLAEEVFYAAVAVDGPSGTTTVDARPSDALNLALIAGAPIRVDPTVFAATAVTEASADVPDESWESAAQIAAALQVVVVQPSSR